MNGRDWTDADREAFKQTVFEQIARYSPNFRSLVLHAEVRTPRELEDEVGLTEGNIFQGELTFDQLLFNRPFPGYAQYRGPVRGLYMCGSATHPGGGVMAAPGANAAREMLLDLRRERRCRKGGAMTERLPDDRHRRRPQRPGVRGVSRARRPPGAGARGSERVGGAAVTREFAPGFRVSAVAHLLHLLDPDRAGAGAWHGTASSYAHAALATVALSRMRRRSLLDAGDRSAARCRPPTAPHSQSFVPRMQRFARVLGRQHGRVPPRLAWRSWRDALPAAASRSRCGASAARHARVPARRCR